MKILSLPGSNTTSPFQITIDCLCIVFLLMFPHYAHMPFYSYSIICFLLVLFYLRKQKKTLRDIGLKRKGITNHTIIVGIWTGLLWVAFIQWVYIPFIMHFFKPFVKAYTEYDFIRNHLAMLLMTIAASWIVGGFYEEIVFRGFIQATFQKWFGKATYSFWISALATSILFSLYHVQQGAFGIVPAMLGALFWSAILKRYNCNLWYIIISHAVYDTTVLILIYYGKLGS